MAGKTAGKFSSKVTSRQDIISETERVINAEAMPGEWKGQFKLLENAPESLTSMELSPKVYTKQVLFKDPKTGQMFRVFQRNDIDPFSIVPKGKYKGKTNLDAMLSGYAPYTVDK